MHYAQSMAIQDRMAQVLELIQLGGYSTPLLARELAVSVPTISRTIQTLRSMGHQIQAVKRDGSWYYVLTETGGAKDER